MSWNKDKRIPKEEIQVKVTAATVAFAEEFGTYLATNDDDKKEAALTTSQLRRFFGEVKSQQLTDYDETAFAMLKPKLAYAVGRARKNGKGFYQKIEDLYTVLTDAIDHVISSPDHELARKNFITIFEAIVAYHKKFEKE